MAVEPFILFCLFQDHVHDVNAFVRSRVLQIWLSIVNEKVIDDYCLDTSDSVA